MKRMVAAAICCVIFSGCASVAPSVPADYAGPKATLYDTSIAGSSSQIDIFYLAELDGRAIQDYRYKTRMANQGRGLSINPIISSNALIAGSPVNLKIVGRTEYAAPILALTHPVYEVKGVVQITPEPNTNYVVKGELGEKYSAVWIENLATHTLVGTKIEVNGSAALGMFDK